MANVVGQKPASSVDPADAECISDCKERDELIEQRDQGYSAKAGDCGFVQSFYIEFRELLTIYEIFLLHRPPFSRNPNLCALHFVVILVWLFS